MKGPNYTQIPNLLLDELLPSLSEKELKVLLYVMRRTLGFHKKKDSISISQLCKGIEGKDKGTGLSNRAVIDALEKLNDKQLIVLEKKDRKTTKISLKIDDTPYEQSSQVTKETSEKSSQVPYEQSSQTKERERNKDIGAKFVFVEYLEKLKLDKQPHINVIGHYIQKKIDDGADMSHLDSKETVGIFIKRNLRDARDLVPFGPSKVLATMSEISEHARKLNYDWKLSTVVNKLR